MGPVCGASAWSPHGYTDKDRSAVAIMEYTEHAYNAVPGTTAVRG